MDDRQADLLADFGLAGADRFNILLVEHDGGRVPWASRNCSSLSSARRGRDPEAAAFAAPVVLIAGSAENPLPERLRYECDCGIVVGESRESPRLP